MPSTHAREHVVNEQCPNTFSNICPKLNHSYHNMLYPIRLHISMQFIKICFFPKIIVQQACQLFHQPLFGDLSLVTHFWEIIHGLYPSHCLRCAVTAVMSDDYRAIALSSPICKVLDTVILRKYGDLLSTCDLQNMVRPMLVHLWSRKPSNIICRTAVMCMVHCWMQRRPVIESTSVNYSER